MINVTSDVDAREINDRSIGGEETNLIGDGGGGGNGRAACAKRKAYTVVRTGRDATS